MAGFLNLFKYAEAVNERTHYSTWRKRGTLAASGCWFDFSMTQGQPGPQYYAAAPLVAQQMKKSTDGGLNHGPDVSPLTKYLSRFLIMADAATPMPMPFILADYLLFYPFIDQGTTDAQIMDNTNTLPRYTDGLGVQIMVVNVAANSAGFPTFTVSYTNSDGVSGRTTGAAFVTIQTITGTIGSAYGNIFSNDIFLGLQGDDKGVRSIESITFANVDTGLFALVLVRPLINSVILETTAPCEIVSLPHQNKLPRIYDDAMLSIIGFPQGSIALVGFNGEIETIYTEE